MALPPAELLRMKLAPSLTPSANPVDSTEYILGPASFHILHHHLGGPSLHPLSLGHLSDDRLSNFCPCPTTVYSSHGHQRAPSRCISRGFAAHGLNAQQFLAPSGLRATLPGALHSSPIGLLAAPENTPSSSSPLPLAAPSCSTLPRSLRAQPGF